ITAPNKHNASVAPESQRSFSRVFGTCSPSPFRAPPQRARARGSRGIPLLQLAHEFLENAATMLVVFKLIETGTGRREHPDIAGPGSRKRDFHGAFERSGALQGHAPGDLPFDFF